MEEGASSSYAHFARVARVESVQFARKLTTSSMGLEKKVSYKGHTCIATFIL